MNWVLLAFPLQRGLAEHRASPLQARLGRLDWRHSIDNKSPVGTSDAIADTSVAIVSSLHHVARIDLHCPPLVRSSVNFLCLKLRGNL